MSNSNLTRRKRHGKRERGGGGEGEGERGEEKRGREKGKREGEERRGEEREERERNRNTELTFTPYPQCMSICTGRASIPAIYCTLLEFFNTNFKDTISFSRNSLLRKCVCTVFDRQLGGIRFCYHCV